MKQHVGDEAPGLVATRWAVEEWRVSRYACVPRVSVVVRAGTACAQREQTLWSTLKFIGTLLSGGSL